VTEVALIDAGGANLGSVRYALERLGVQVRLVRDAQGLEGVSRVILPGVGAAPHGMARLHAQGLVEPLRNLQVPLLGICLGMQLLFDGSEEGHVECLGLLPGVVRHLRPATGIRVPHMGWNRLLPLRESPLLAGVPARASAYFVHSYAAPLGEDTVAACGCCRAITRSRPPTAMTRCRARRPLPRPAQAGCTWWTWMRPGQAVTRWRRCWLRSRRRPA